MANNSSQRSHLRQDRPEVIESSDDSNESNGIESYDPHPKGRVRGYQISRPPSSHITRVDEEPSGSDGRKSGARSVETVDRGVGPTPRPPPPPPAAAAEPRVPPYLSFQPFPDAARNGLLEAYGLSYPYTHYPYTINPPIPLSPSILEGRYHWPPTSSFGHHIHGLAPNPAQGEISLLSMRSPILPGETMVTQLASRIHYEQLQRNYYHNISSRRFSPASLPGLPLSSSPFLGEYPPPSISGRSLFSDVPPTPGSGSITLPGSLESSRLTSPRHSIVGGKSRKRALSHSPISDYLDIQSLTRSSEGSLHLAPFLQPSSRSSSAASGSYGHLSAASFGTVSPSQLILPTNPYLRSEGMGPSSIFFPHLHPLVGRQPPSISHLLPPGPHMTHTVPKFEPQAQISTTTKEPGSSSIVSSTMDSSGDLQKMKAKKELASLHTATVEPEDDDENFGDRGGNMPQEGEPDFIETNCHWIGCNGEFESQDDLVKHINQDHIQSNKKSFVCRWQDCSREEKPFKAQYMLVVHMRRHTGEKPHRCTFEGCTKAYSRLENLKTHLRSHTGEKPYMCEFPGCTKAFSNASDRAKHQNRTHSNAKPYICKAVGCTKRYTDPSSLRKHVKTVHGADFYANKKHKGDATCQVKREDPDGDHQSCQAHRRTEENVGTSVSVIHLSGSHQSRFQENSGSAPSSQSQPSPDSSPEVNVTCSMGRGQGNLLDDHRNPGGGHLDGLGLLSEIILPEFSEIEIPGSDVLLTRRNRINVGEVMQNQLKCRINSKLGGSSIPHIPNGSNIGSRLIQVSVSPLLSQGSHLKLNRQGQITDITGAEQQRTWRDSSTTLLPTSRRESNSSTLSSYMSSMRSMGSTFSSRRSSGASQFSSRRSSGVSARLSIANSPYEYDITGNLPDSASRRSSGESSTNIGKMSAMMQKTTLNNHPVMPPVSGVISAGVGVCTNQLPLNGYKSILGNKCYNDRIARYFSSRLESNGYTSTPCTPVPHDIPDREIRRASDPIKTQDPILSPQKSMHRFHSLNGMKPLPVPPRMHSLYDKPEVGRDMGTNAGNLKASSNPFQTGCNGTVVKEEIMTSQITEAELEVKMLEDSEDVIIPDDMRQFLNECLKGENSAQASDCDGGLNQFELLEECGELDFNFEDCDFQPDDSAEIFSSPCPDTRSNNNFIESGSTSEDYLVHGNLQLQANFADLLQGSAASGPYPAVVFDQIGTSQPNLSASDTISNELWPILEGLTEEVKNQQTLQGFSSNQNGTSPHQNHLHLHHGQQQLHCQQVCVSGTSSGHLESCQNNTGRVAGNGICCRDSIIGRSISGSGPAGISSVGSNNIASALKQESDDSQRRTACEMESDGGIYLSQHNLIQHQLQLQQHQPQQANGLTKPSFTPHPPTHRPGFQRGRYHNNSAYPIGNFKPQPPAGVKPQNHRQKCSSPQVQVPQISQSQIPANAKAASRGQPLVKQQQIATNSSCNYNQSPSSYTNQPQENHGAKVHLNQNTPSQNHQPCPRPPPFYPSPKICQTSASLPGNSVGQSQLINEYMDMNHITEQLSHPSLLTDNTLSPGHLENINPLQPSHFPNTPHLHHPRMLTQTPDLSSLEPRGQSLMSSQCRCENPLSALEMSPGCDQVTSSTDCKENMILPLEDFMANLTSISTENLMVNLHSVSQENIVVSPTPASMRSVSQNSGSFIVVSPTPASMRSVSQNSGRFSVLMNTSNMAVVDLSSVLTQLAEENKFLSMRP